ncbi:hypothetical protein QBC39DRAFT_333072 [Podospora conica]|nr:hypothetical protein QBC39DRAFT_333072 [Schizothecium conicum]
MAETNTPAPTPTPTIRFQNNPSNGPPGIIFTIPLASTKRSAILTDLLGDLFDTSDLTSAGSEDIIIPLMIDRTSDAALAKVATWLNTNVPQAPTPAPTSPSTTTPFSNPRLDLCLDAEDEDDDLAAPLPEREAALLDIPYARLFEVMIASNYLGIALLSRQCAQVVAERLRGLSTVQIRRVLCIRDEDLTPEQREREGLLRKAKEQEEAAMMKEFEKSEKRKRELAEETRKVDEKRRKEDDEERERMAREE